MSAWHRNRGGRERVGSSPRSSSETRSSWSARRASRSRRSPDELGVYGSTLGNWIKQVADELGTYDSTLDNWVKQDRIDRGEREGLTSQDRARLSELEAENARLRMERDLLKRSVAFWVQETSTR